MALATRYASSAMLRTMQIEEAVAMKTVKMVFSVGREMKQSTRLGHGHWWHWTSRGIWKPSYTVYRAYLCERGENMCRVDATTKAVSESQGLHEPSFKQQPEQQAAGICPPEGASYGESALLQGLQLLLLALVAEKTHSAWSLSSKHMTNKMTHDMEKHASFEHTHLQEPLLVPVVTIGHVHGD